MAGAGGNASTAQQVEQVVSDVRVELDRYAAVPASRKADAFEHRDEFGPGHRAVEEVRRGFFGVVGL